MGSKTKRNRLSEWKTVMSKLIKYYETTTQRPLPKIVSSSDADATFDQVKGALDRVSPTTKKNRMRRLSQLKVTSIYNLLCRASNVQLDGSRSDSDSDSDG